LSFFSLSENFTSRILRGRMRDSKTKKGNNQASDNFVRENCRREVILIICHNELTLFVRE
jgi:hypothetical protein